jgi:hypothetical protein
MLTFFAKTLVFFSILFAFNQALAGRVASLYDVEIPVVNESAAVRTQAFDQGLDEVFKRKSGDSIVMDKLKRPPSSRYVKQFSYEPMSSPMENADTNKDGETQTHRLKIHYNGRLMEKYLLENGFPAWGEYRPDVVVWLVVRDGRNEYVLKGSDQSLLKKATDEAMARRGIPVSWPLYDNKDKKALNVADIRGGFKQPVLKASRRYSRGPVLTGSLIWNGKQWQSGWSLLVEGENRHWNLDDVDHKQLINKSIDQAADVLGVFFAVHNAADKQQDVNIRLDIQAVNSIEKYRYVENYLTGLSAVEKVKPFKVDGQNAVFEVSLRSNEEDFFNLIKNGAELVEIKAPPAKAQVIPDNKPVNVVEKDSTAGIVAEATETKDIKETKEVEKNDAYLPLSQLPLSQLPVYQEPVYQVPVYYYRLNRQ